MPKILLIDDHPLYRHGVVSLFGERLPAYEVVAVDSAEQGLEILERTDIDLAIIDLRLPGMDGLAALNIVAQRHPTVPRIAISGDESPELMRRAFDVGAAGFVPKSMAVAELISAINKVLDGGMFVPNGTLLQASQAPPGGLSLTLRQFEVLRLLSEGYTNRSIADALNITERTARAHVAAILEALGVENRTQAVSVAIRRGWLPHTEMGTRE